MTNRTKTDVENFIYEIDRLWKLSLNEKEYLEKVLSKVQNYDTKS